MMQMNVVNADVLRKAQKNPEQYTDLQIRVSGWSVHFNDIKKEEQDGFIRQAETAWFLKNPRQNCRGILSLPWLLDELVLHLFAQVHEADIPAA